MLANENHASLIDYVVSLTISVRSCYISTLIHILLLRILPVLTESNFICQGSQWQPTHGTDSRLDWEADVIATAVSKESVTAFI